MSTERQRAYWHHQQWWPKFLRSWRYIGELHAQPSAGFAAIEASRVRPRFVEERKK